MSYEEKIAVADYLSVNADNDHILSESNSPRQLRLNYIYANAESANIDIASVDADDRYRMGANILRKLSDEVNENPSLDIYDLISQKSYTEQYAVGRFLRERDFFVNEYPYYNYDHQAGYNENDAFYFMSSPDYGVNESKVWLNLSNKINDMLNESTRELQMEHTPQQIIEEIEMQLDDVSMQDNAKFERRLNTYSEEDRIAVAEYLEQNPDGLHKLSMSAEEMRRSYGVTADEVANNPPLKNVRSMSTEELAKEFAEREIRYTNRQGTDEDKQRLNEINQYLQNEYDDYGFKRFADLVKRESGVSLTSFRILEEGIDKWEQYAISNNALNSVDKPIFSNNYTIGENTSGLDNKFDENEIRFIEYKTTEITKPEEDVKVAAEKVKVDNSQFLFNYDAVDDAPEKEERKRLSDRLKETFGKVANGVKTFTSNFVSEAMRPLKEQVVSLQEQVVSVTEQANKQLANANEKIGQLQNQIAAMKESFGAQLNEARQRIAPLGTLLAKANDKIMQLTEQGKKANEQIKFLQGEVEKTAKENASLKRQLAELGENLDTGTSYNLGNDNKFKSFESKILSLQEELQNIKDENMGLKIELNEKKERDVILEEVVKASKSNSSLEEVMREAGAAMKNIMYVEQADIYCIDPIKNAPYRVNEYNEREYIDVKKGSYIEKALTSGETVINNEYNNEEIGDNDPKYGIHNVAVIPYTAKDESGNDKVIGFAVAKNPRTLSDFDADKTVKYVKETMNIFTDKIQSEHQKDVLTKDPLTSLDNKQGVEALLSSKIYDDIQNNVPVAAFKIAVDDVDSLDKSIENAAYLHVANILNNNNREGDIVVTPSHLDKNEFMVFVQGEHGSSPKEVETQAYSYAERMCRLISETPIRLDDDSMVQITASAGVAMLDEDKFINKSRDQMSEVFTHTTNEIINDNCRDAYELGGNQVIASCEIMSENTKEAVKAALFIANEDIKTFTTPLLGNNNSDLVLMQKDYDSGIQAVASLSVKGTPELRYNGVVYNDPETYPAELVNKLQTYNYDGIEVIKEPIIELAVAIYDSATNENVKMETFEWKPSDLSGSAETIRQRLLAKSTDVVKEYEQSRENTYSRENTSNDTQERRRRTDIERG